MGKGKVHYIEVISDDEEDEEIEGFNNKLGFRKAIREGPAT
jgi:hypothetical protein